jgi:subtilisin family serine protease
MWLGVVMLLPVGALAGGSPNFDGVRARRAPVTSPRLFEWAQNDSEAKRIWVYFTDRGSAASDVVALSNRALERRQRVAVASEAVGRGHVAPEYIDLVREAGGEVHRISRWLNAVSVSYDPVAVQRLQALPFVAMIEPVARYYRMPEPAVDMRPQASTSSASMLDYGSSAPQLQQIKADLAHGRGYTGAGVLVAMFDTGFRKDHTAFSTAYAEGRVLAEYDFIFDDGNTQNEGVDDPSQHNHGTSTWSVLGGTYPTQLYGPAYGASFILAKTEDVRSEMPVEEDNWEAAVEWADSLGADVISSSLAYSDWYTYADFDGETAVTTLAANMATSVGIVVCNSAGNAGPGSGTIAAPADAFGILTCGAVTSTGSISSFSSRGPTFDGRIKPEVCARGSSTWLATAASTTSAGSASGTSFSCPLVAGCAALVREAHPAWNPLMVREALMQTASQSSAPNNTFGWGIVDVNAALDYDGSILVTAAALPETLLAYDALLPLRAYATSVSPVDPAASTLYYRVDGGAYAGVPLFAAAPDTVAGSVPLPSSTFSLIEYYYVVFDTVGFSARSPEPLIEVHSFVWQTLLGGDTTKDKVVNIGDILALVSYIFKSGPAFDPIALGDVDNNASINSSDVVYLVNFVFKSGPAPVLP